MCRIVTMQVSIVAEVGCQIVWLILGTGGAERQHGQQNRFGDRGEREMTHTVQDSLKGWDREAGADDIGFSGRQVTASLAGFLSFAATGSQS